MEKDSGLEVIPKLLGMAGRGLSGTGGKLGGLGSKLWGALPGLGGAATKAAPAAASAAPAAAASAAPGLLGRAGGALAATPGATWRGIKATPGVIGSVGSAIGGNPIAQAGGRTLLGAGGGWGLDSAIASPEVQAKIPGLETIDKYNQSLTGGNLFKILGAGAGLGANRNPGGLGRVYKGLAHPGMIGVSAFAGGLGQADRLAAQQNEHHTQANRDLKGEIAKLKEQAGNVGSAGVSAAKGVANKATSAVSNTASGIVDKAKGMYSGLPNYGKAGLIGAGALGLGGLGSYMAGEEDDPANPGRKKKRAPWLGPMLGAGALGAGAYHLADNGKNWGQLGSPDFWSKSGEDVAQPPKIEAARALLQSMLNLPSNAQTAIQNTDARGAMGAGMSTALGTAALGGTALGAGYLAHQATKKKNPKTGQMESSMPWVGPATGLATLVGIPAAGYLMNKRSSHMPLILHHVKKK